MVADSDVIDEVASQAMDTTSQVEEAAPDESPDVVSEVTPDVEAVDVPEPVADSAVETDDQPSPEVAPPDLTSLTPKQLEDLNPELASALRNAGAQSREAQLRREAGSREATRARVQAIKAKLAELPDNDAAGLDFVWDNAAANAQEAIMRQMAEQAIQSFDPSPEERQALESAVSSLEGDALSQYAAQVVSIAADRVGRKTVYDMSIDDIPADSNLAKSARAREAKRIESEAQASEIEGKAGRSIDLMAADPAAR